jgi:hypothetical protein
MTDIESKEYPRSRCETCPIDKGFSGSSTASLQSVERICRAIKKLAERGWPDRPELVNTGTFYDHPNTLLAFSDEAVVAAACMKVCGDKILQPQPDSLSYLS